MRRIGFLLVICSLLGFTAIPTHADDPAILKKEKHPIVGTVKSLGTDTLTLSVENKKGTKSKEHTIRVTKQTTVTIDGKGGALSDVAVGESVKITMEHGQAEQIEITTATAAPARP